MIFIFTLTILFPQVHGQLCARLSALHWGFGEEDTIVLLSWSPWAICTSQLWNIKSAGLLFSWWQGPLQFLLCFFPQNKEPLTLSPTDQHLPINASCLGVCSYDFPPNQFQFFVFDQPYDFSLIPHLNPDAFLLEKLSSLAPSCIPGCLSQNPNDLLPWAPIHTVQVWCHIRTYAFVGCVWQALRSLTPLASILEVFVISAFHCD